VISCGVRKKAGNLRETTTITVSGGKGIKKQRIPGEGIFTNPAQSE
jgi:hypothetical protein